MNGAELIAAERAAHVTREKWTDEQDDSYTGGELVDAAVCYLVPRFSRTYWPWAQSWWKPTPDDRVRELVKAGALIAAEIDRLQRAVLPETKP